MEPFTNTETFTAYHVVTDRPMQVGQQIRFDTAHHNGVYRRVMEKRADIDEIYAHPERYDAAALEHHTSVALREFALEEVRQARYPSYPQDSPACMSPSAFPTRRCGPNCFLRGNVPPITS